jgi:hypothetical protein
MGGPPGGRSVRPPAGDPFGPPPGALPPGARPSGLPSAPPGGLAPGRSAPPGTVPAAPLDPFAAAAPAAGAREVRLVIDDKAVSDAEVGRKGGGKFVIGAIAAAIVGVAVGWFVGTTARERQIYDLVLADAKDVYKSTSDATATVEKAQKLLDQALKAAAPAADKAVEVDFKAMEELRKLSKPFPADVFSRKYYRAFGPATVDSLFTYYNNTNLLWAKIGVITARAVAQKDSLEKAAKAADGLAKSDYGCVPFKDGDNFSCGLVNVKRTEDGKGLQVVTRGGSYDKTAFAGQDLGTKTSDYVIMIDKGRSNDILGAPTSVFQTYARDLMEAKTLADQTLEIQGRLIQQLGELAKLQSLN